MKKDLWSNDKFIDELLYKIALLNGDTSRAINLASNLRKETDDPIEQYLCDIDILIANHATSGDKG